MYTSLVHMWELVHHFRVAALDTRACIAMCKVITANAAWSAYILSYYNYI